MPEDKVVPSPGSKPKSGQGKLRPTVINPSGGQTRRPVAKAGKEGGTDTLAGPVVKARTGEARSSKTLKADQSAPERPGAARPTAIPGVERKRIAVDLAGIRKLSPQAKAGVTERALRLVQAFVVEGVRDRQAVLWGHRLQQDYSDLVSRTLVLSQADVLKRVAGYIGRMTEILGSIDLEAVCGAAPAVGLLGQYLKGVNKKIDTPEELRKARIELDQLVRLMGEALEQLLSLKETLEQHSSRTEQMGDEMEASALAALFLSAHLRKGQPGLSQRFLERSMSLTQTVAQIRGNTSMREVQIEQPLRLIGAIQNVALVMVPGWLGSIAALTAMLESKRELTPTEAGELAYQLRNILQQLKA